MVDSEENYKFDLGVKGLKEPVHYEIRLLRYLLINFFCWTFKVIFIDNLLWIWNNLNECKLTKACKALVRTLGSLSFAKLANKFCAPTCGSDSNLLGPPSNPWFRWPIRQRHWQRTEKWGSFRCLEEKKKKKLNQINSTW